MDSSKWQIKSSWRRVGLVVFLAAVVALAVWPLNRVLGEERTYESSAVLNLLIPEEFQQEELREGYLKKEEAQVLSDAVLYPVVAGLELGEEWSLSDSQAVVTLRGKTEVKRLSSKEDRQRFSITVQASSAELACSMAAEVASQYQSQGNAKARQEWEQKLRGLDAEIEAQKKLVEKKRLQMEKVLREAGLGPVESSGEEVENGRG